MTITLTIRHNKKAKDKKHNSKRYNSTPNVLVTSSIWIPWKREAQVAEYLLDSRGMRVRATLL